MQSDKRFLVSVLIITYNQEKYIRQAIDSVLFQVTDFDFEIVIGDDCSTDSTRKILSEYKEKYPDKIRLLLNEKNLGVMQNIINVYNSCNGEYIAFLEGDDYWTDSSKLQMQANFLKDHPDCSLCFHNSTIHFEDSNSDSPYCEPDQKQFSELIDTFEKNFIPTASILLRKKCLSSLPDWFTEIKLGDWALIILMAREGKLGYINKAMSVYRIHKNGFWSSKTELDNILAKIDFYNCINKYLLYKYDDLISKQLFVLKERLRKINPDKVEPFVAIFTPNFGTLSETFIQKHIEFLAPGNTVVVTGTIFDHSWANVPVLQIPYSEGPAKYSFETEKRVEEFLVNHSVTHILVEYGCYGTEIVELNNRKLKLPIFLHFHGGDAAAMLRRREMVNHYKWMSELVTGVIAVARPMADRLINIGIPSKKVFINHYGIEIPEVVESRPEKSPCRFVFVGRMTAKKAPDLALKAFTKAYAMNKNIHFDLIGDYHLLNQTTYLKTQLEKYVFENGLQDAVTFHGAQPNEYVKKILNQSSVYVQHSVTVPETGDAEGLPNTILEASAHGLPVISTFHEGIPEEVENFITGLLVDEFDVDKMAAFMQKLATNPELRKQMGHAGQEKIKNEFSVQNSIDGLRKIIFSKYETKSMKSLKALVADSILNIDEAKKLCIKELENNPLDDEAYFQLGEIDYTHKNFESALRHYKTAKNISENREDATVKIVLSYIQLNKLPEAIKFLKQALVENPYNEYLQEIFKQLNITLEWEDLKNFSKLKLYAGDIPEEDKYKNLVGLSIENKDHRHIFHDVTQPFLLEDNSVDSFQAEDVFEHIDYEKLPDVFNEIYRVLKPGATFRLSIPDYGCDVLRERSVLDENGKVIFDPGGGGTVENPGHLWYPLFSKVKTLLEKTEFAKSGAINFLHHYNSDGTFCLKEIDYSKGFVKRNPDNDKRVQNPRRPMSLIVDLTKSEGELKVRNNSFPKISFIMIVLNGMPFIEFALKSIYDFAHDITIVEGAVEKCSFAANPDGSSKDGTVNTIKNFPDPQKKIKFVSGSWPEKMEMHNKALEYVEGDYVWLVDSDEIYKKKDIESVVSLIKKDPSITQVNFIPDNFWKGFDNIFVSPFFFQEEAHYRRVFRFIKGAKFISHRPPKLLLPGINKTAEDLNLIDGITTRKMGIYPYHYSYVFDKQVKQKVELYNLYGWGNNWGIEINKWFTEGYLKWTPEIKTEIEKVYAPWTGDKNSWSQSFQGEHPEVMREFINEYNNKNVFKGSFQKSIDIIGSLDQQRKVLKAWENIELDDPLKIRKNWIEENVKNSKSFWNVHLAISYTAEKLKPANYLEVGVRTGGSLSQALYNSSVKNAVLVDLWAGSYANLPNTIEFTKNQFENFQKLTGNNCSLEFIQGNSHSILKELIRQGRKFEMINVDGDHTEEGGWEDLIDAEKLLADKGAIIFDDIIHPIHKYLLNFVERFTKLFPEFKAIVNAEQDNGCVILLKNISVEEFLTEENPVKKKLKIAAECATERDLTEVDEHSSFSKSINDIFRKIKPKKIIETGTYLGSGTTKIIASAIKSLSLNDAQFYSIEINPDNYRQASENLKKENLLPYVKLLNGVSVPRKILPNFSDIKNYTVDNVEYENIFVDHDENERARLYFQETNFTNVPENLLGKCLAEFDYKPDFVLLDSAGHMGYVEFNYLINELKSECYIALDDIYHIKHHKSFLHIQRDPRFEMVVSSKEKFGFCIAKFNPAKQFIENEKQNDNKKILFVRTDSIGDCLLALSVLNEIHNSSPGYVIDVLCQEHIAEIYEAVPFVNKIITFNNNYFLENPDYKFEVAGKLKANKYDLLINSIYSRSEASEFFSTTADADVKIAFEGSSSNLSKERLKEYNKHYTRLIPSEGSHKSELKRYENFLEALGIKAATLEPAVWVNEGDELFADELFNKYSLTKEKTIALFAGAQQELRVYDHYGKAINQYCIDSDITIIVLGSSGDKYVNEKNLKDISTKVIDLSGKTTIRQSAAILHRCSLAVGAETGLAHLACAVKTPNVIVIGGGHFGRFMPYSSLTTLIVNPIDCYGCNWFCKFNEAKCVKNISPGLLTEAIKSVLTSESSKPRIFVERVLEYEEKKIISSFVNPDEVEIIFVEKNFLAKGGTDNEIPLTETNSIEGDFLKVNDNSSLYRKYDIKTAEELISNGKYSEAELILEQLLINENGNLDVLNDLAVTKITQHKWKEAVSCLNNIFNIQPENELAWNNHLYVKEILGEEINHYDSASSFEEYFGRIRFPKKVGYPGISSNQIKNQFKSYGIEVLDYQVDVKDYRNYFESAGYNSTYKNYYSFNIHEKSLEHYVASKLLKLNDKDIYIDIASEGSPVPEIYNKLFRSETYRQDLSYPQGLNGNTIGGDASNMPVPNEFATKMALHCSFEHFESNADIKFIKEIKRVLKSGGSVCILPLYMADEYSVLTEPKVAVGEKVQFETDVKVCGIKGWNNRHGRFYSVEKFNERILSNLENMKIQVYRITNQKDVHESCYLNFVAVITKEDQ